MLLERFTQVEEFIAAAEPTLLAEEAANCLPLGLLAALRDGRSADPYLGVVSRARKPLLIAMQTPPYRLILAPASTRLTVSSPTPTTTDGDQGATGARGDDPLAPLEPLIDDLPSTLPGVLGPVEQTAYFADVYCSRHGLMSHLVMTEQIYQCEQVTPPTGVPGAMRRATPAERDLLISWYAGFQSEAGLNQPHDAEEAVTRDLADPHGGVWLWLIEGKPVSLAGSRGPTRHGIRIGPVFTPPELRGHGYASALVATLTQELLTSGRRYVFLFTDLANSAVNTLYQRLGYRAVAQRSAYDFAA